MPGNIVFEDGGDSGLKGLASARQIEQPFIVLKDCVWPRAQHGPFGLKSHNAYPAQTVFPIATSALRGFIIAQIGRVKRAPS
jgi:hypothetical protein